MSLAGAEGEVLEQAVRYLRVVFCGSLFVNLGQSTNMIMRGEGKLKRAMTIMATSAILNIILDPILIKVCGEGNGVLGAALSLQTFSFIPLWGISQGFQPAIGTNYGAKLFDRVGKFTRRTSAK